MMNIGKKFIWLLIILWMVLIFYLSHQPVTKSNNLSKGITEMTIDTVKRIAPEAEFNPGRFNHLLRKNAHFFTYFILGILLMLGLKVFGITGHKAMAMALLISVLYAISDEVHQLFVPGRGGQARDVLIDSFGAATGIIVYKALIGLLKN